MVQHMYLECSSRPVLHESPAVTPSRTSPAGQWRHTVTDQDTIAQHEEGVNAHACKEEVEDVINSLVLQYQ